MSHELTIRANGFVEMATREGSAVSWHALENHFRANATLMEKIESAGLDWRILRGIVRYAFERDQDAANYATYDDKHVLFRSDTKAPLGVVSDTFKIVQPYNLIKSIHDIVDECGFTMDAIASMFGGRRFFAQAEIGEESYVADPRDKLKRYLLASTSCDGTRATEYRYIDGRVVCNNTLQAAFGEADAKVRITHRSTVNVANVREELGVDRAHDTFRETMDNFRRMADTKVTVQDAILQIVNTVQPAALKLEGKELEKVLRSKPILTIAGLAVDGNAKGSEFQGVAGTQWGLLNAITEYTDHFARTKFNSDENRIDSALFGKGSDIKNRAYDLCMLAADGTPASTFTTFRADHGVESGSLLDDVLANMPSHV